MFEASVPHPLALVFPLLICIITVFPSPEMPSLLLSSLRLSPDAYDDDGAATSEPVTKTDAAKMAINPKVVFEVIILYYPCILLCIYKVGFPILQNISV